MMNDLSWERNIPLKLWWTPYLLQQPRMNGSEKPKYNYFYCAPTHLRWAPLSDRLGCRHMPRVQIEAGYSTMKDRGIFVNVKNPRTRVLSFSQDGLFQAEQSRAVRAKSGVSYDCCKRRGAYKRPEKPSDTPYQNRPRGVCSTVFFS